MANFMAASIWMKVALVSLVVGTLLFIIGFSTVSWMVYSTFTHWVARGVWRYQDCSTSRQTCYYGPWGSWSHFGYDDNDYVRATQALECIGLVCDLVALLVLLLYLFVDQCRRRNALIAVIVFIFAAVFFMVVGIAVFGIKLDNYGYTVGWSMGFAIVGAIFIFVSGIMCILQMIGR